MTAIMSFVRSDTTLQVSDRLVSARRREMITPFDFAANKSVVVGAHDSVIAVGYSGIAYFRETPADLLLAGWIAGGPPTGGMSLRPNAPLHLQAIASRIQLGLERELQVGGHRYDDIPHEVVIAGRQRRRGGEEVPILWIIRRANLRGSDTELSRRDLSLLRRGQGFWLEATGNVPEEFVHLMHRDPKLSSGNIEEIQEALRETLTEVAAVVDGVGADAMVVTIRRRNEAVSVEYRPAEPSEEVGVGEHGETVSAAFTPTFIGHSVVIPPAHFDSFRGFEVDGLRVENIAPGSRGYWDRQKKLLVAGWAVQPRPLPPGR